MTFDFHNFILGLETSATTKGPASSWSGSIDVALSEYHIMIIIITITITIN